MTCAPSSAASLMPWARVAEVPLSMLFTLTDRIVAAGATPSNGTPCACRSLAAMMRRDLGAVTHDSPGKPVPVRSMAVTWPASWGL